MAPLAVAALLLGTALIAAATAADPALDSHWGAWRDMHGKSYEQAEEGQRRLVWEHNLKMIDRHNLEEALGKHSYTLAMNQFGDMTEEEFVQTMTRPMLVNETEVAAEFVTFEPPPNFTAPSRVDWRKTGAVTDVKNQGACGSCWAFSSTGALEGQWKLRRGQLVSLSEQNLVDCSRVGNYGCRGGFMVNAFKYIHQNRGIAYERSYPYTGQDNRPCRYDPRSRGAYLTSYGRIRKNSEAGLQQAVANVGPVAVGMDASQRSFQFYRNGVYYDPRCSRTRINHAMLVVGYDQEGGHEYWIVKNSWSKRWGDGGYIKMAKHRNNNCGISNYACYPIV
ncbi:cathepsin S-like [Petromyzon marinus]|uniref:Cathepsin L1-like n=1 Tax=Petromyzon marinus TaxID=7757 RepID=A0AAJ7XF18_PETMA|nr:cathepsin L1-like [Petromyzon marinus]